MGTLLIAIALFTPQGTVAALYYMVHSTFAAAALFLVADLVQERRGRWGGI
jgi:multicomponent K+:H+ antiporter subunit D